MPFLISLLIKSRKHLVEISPELGVTAAISGAIVVELRTETNISCANRKNAGQEPTSFAP